MRIRLIPFEDAIYANDKFMIAAGEDRSYGESGMEGNTTAEGKGPNIGGRKKNWRCIMKARINIAETLKGTDCQKDRRFEKNGRARSIKSLGSAHFFSVGWETGNKHFFLLRLTVTGGIYHLHYTV